MKKRPTKKRASAQARAVIIPSDPSLQAHAAAIRELGRQSFEAVVEIGERLIECREILKAKRVWLAWLKAEFRWSRRQADNMIDLARAKGEGRLRDVAQFGLPIHALYLLAKAPPETIQHVTRHIEAGGQASVRKVMELNRVVKEFAQTHAAALSESSRRTYLQAPSAPQRILTVDDMKMPALEVQSFIRDLEHICIKLGDMINKGIDEAPLTANDRREVVNYCGVIGEHAATIAQSVEYARLSVVSNDDETKH